jgi:hypothetical protein
MDNLVWIFGQLLQDEIMINQGFSIGLIKIRRIIRHKNHRGVDRSGKQHDSMVLAFHNLTEFVRKKLKMIME